MSLNLRFTEGMRANLEQDAKKNHRSLNSEIVYRLGTTYGAEGVALAAQYDEFEKEMQRRFREMMDKFAKQIVVTRR